MKKWTPQQQAAISDRGRSVIVSAAAGSGKTAVLVERLLEILSDTVHPVRADEIIVVTFTNDAAAQMKKRLSDALEQKMRTETDDAVYDWLFSQNTRLHHAKISTINAFCFDLVRENADICGVASNFRIAEPAEERVYENEAIQQVLSRWGSERRRDMELLVENLCSLDDGEISEVILSLKDFLDTAAFPRYWIQRAAALCADPSVLLNAACRDLCDALEKILAFAEQSRIYAEAAGSVYAQLWEEDMTNIRYHLQFLQSADAGTLMETPLVHQAEFTRFSTKQAADKEAREVFKGFRDVYKTRYQNAVTGYLGGMRFLEQDSETERRVIPLLLDITQEYMKTLMDIKKERNVLGFSDGERLALDLLGKVTEDGEIVRTDLGVQLSAFYKLIMVDEYQDSNNKQDCLFKLLSKEGKYEASLKRLQYGSNAFLVGDVKQAIYRFREANPQNFMDVLEDSVLPEKYTDGHSVRMYLSRNFRSAEGVIDFVNGLFRCVMTKDCGEVEYDEREFLNFGAQQYRSMGMQKTRLVLSPLPDKEEDVQLQCTAAVIRDMLDRRVPVLDGENTRPCEPRDFCVLMRSVKKTGPLLREALRQQNIPGAGEENTVFLQSPEIRLIGNFLRILDNPLTDMAMAAVLLSPVYAFTVQELMQLKTDTDVKRIYRQMCSLAAQEQDMPLHQKCRFFLHQFDRLREQADALSLDDLIREIYEETDLLSLQSLYPDAGKRRENLERYPRLAGEYQAHAEQNGSGSLSGWLRYLDCASQGGQDLEGAQTGMENCVSVKTIHGSKGLEFPFVILVHTETGFNTMDKSKALCASESGFLGLTLLDKTRYKRFRTGTHAYITQRQWQMQKSEELRLLYVAVTRAKQQLILVMDREKTLQYVQKNEKLLRKMPGAAAFMAGDANRMAEWIWLYLLSCEEAPYLVQAAEGASCTGRLIEYTVWEASVCSVREEPERAVLHAQPDPLVKQQMLHQLDFSYHSQAADLVSKHSVTSLAHPDKMYTEDLEEPDFQKNPSPEDVHLLRGAARGTAVHKMLQYMDFPAAAQDPEGELARLLEEGRLTEQEAMALTPEKLRHFLRSPLYGRLADSSCVYREKQLFVEIGTLGFPEGSPLAAYAGTDGILIGTIDLLFREADGWVIVDYKTDRNKTAEELQQMYALQVELYRMAAETILGEPVKAVYLYSFALDREIEVPLDGLFTF